MGRIFITHAGTRNTHKTLAGKSHRRDCMGELDVEQEDNIKIFYREIQSEDVSSIEMAQDMDQCGLY